MFLIDAHPHIPPRLQHAAQFVRDGIPLVYEGLLRPLDEKTSVYLHVTNEITRYRKIPTEERARMDAYAMSLLFGDGTVPAGLDPQRASQVREMITPSRHHLRTKHPLRTRRW